MKLYFQQTQETSLETVAVYTIGLSATKMKIPQFWRNVSIVMMGTLIYQLLPLAILPILTRVLSPDEIGIYFTWIAGVLVLSIPLSMRLDMAIYQTRNDEHAIRLVRALIPIASAAAIVITGLGTLFVKFNLVVLPNAITLVLAGGATALFLALNLVVNSVFARAAQFKEQAKWKILLGILIAASQLSLMAGGLGIEGLIYGYTISVTLISLAMLNITGALNRNLFDRSSIGAAFKELSEFKRFVTLSMPAALINTAAAYLPLFLITGRISPEAGGLYGLTHRTLTAPLGLVGGSILSVFRQESSREYFENGNCLASYKKTMFSLATLGIGPFFTLTFFGEEIFRLVFGEPWAHAGLLAQYMAPMIFIRFVASPLSYMFFIANKQMYDLAWQALIFLITLTIFMGLDDLSTAVLAYSATSSCMYTLNLFVSYKIARGAL